MVDTKSEEVLNFENYFSEPFVSHRLSGVVAERAILGAESRGHKPRSNEEVRRGRPPDLHNIRHSPPYLEAGTLVGS